MQSASTASRAAWFQNLIVGKQHKMTVVKKISDVQQTCCTNVCNSSTAPWGTANKWLQTLYGFILLPVLFNMLSRLTLTALALPHLFSAPSSCNVLMAFCTLLCVLVTLKACWHKPVRAVIALTHEAYPIWGEILSFKTVEYLLQQLRGVRLSDCVPLQVLVVCGISQHSSNFLINIRTLKIFLKLTVISWEKTLFSQLVWRAQTLDSWVFSCREKKTRWRKTDTKKTC